VQRLEDCALGAEAIVIQGGVPYNPAHPEADRVIDQLNRKIESIGRTEHVGVLPFHDSLEDPTTPGTTRPEWTADGIHPSVEGYRRLGELALRPPGES
jgi:lysophospholipase L1-like esterase